MSNYEVINWEDNPKHTTALEAANLNHMDAGIAQNAADINTFQTQINSINISNENLSGRVTTIEGELNGLTFVTCSRSYWDNLPKPRSAKTVFFFTS